MRRQTRIIAEMAWAHDGSIDKAIRIMQGAREAGADLVSIHVTSLPDYVVHNYGSGKGKVSAGKEELDIVEYLTAINPNHDDWRRFAAAARETDIGLCVMPNDFPSLEFAETLAPDWYVVAPAAFVEVEFLMAIARTGRPVLLRIGGATLGEIERAVNLFRAHSDAELVLLHGFQNYPTRLEETNIRQLATLRQLFGVEVGLADHIDGADPLARTVPMLAVALGASVIEKHITWDRDEKGEDFESALDPKGFADFVTNIEAAEVALGSGRWQPLSEATLAYRRISRKKTVAARDLPAGTVLRREDFCFKRSDEGAMPDESEYLVGRRLRRALAFDQPIGWDGLE